jgi:hypothetical protein
MREGGPGLSHSHQRGHSKKRVGVVDFFIVVAVAVVLVFLLDDGLF